jgi:ABC-2 type transport system permease protein
VSRATTIAGVSFRQYTRDRTAVFFTLVLPLLLIVVIGLSIGGPSSMRVGVTLEDDGALATALRNHLEQVPDIDLRRYRDSDELRRDVRRGALVVGAVVPRAYDRTLRNGGTAEVTILTGPDPRAVVAQSVVAARVSTQAAEVQAARATPGDFDANLGVAREVAPRSTVAAVEQSALGGNALPTGFEYTAPANLVLFVFISTFAGASVIVISRRLGVTRRMLSTPTTARTIVVGFALGRFSFGFVQGLFILVVGATFFGVDWGDPVAAVVLLTAIAAVGMSAAMLLGAVATTNEQPGTIGPVIGIALGMLGGCMWPLAIVPEFMRVLGHAFPHAWAMDAWIELIGSDAGLVEVAPNLLALAAFTAVLLPLAAWRLRRSVTAPAG